MKQELKHNKWMLAMIIALLLANGITLAFLWTENSRTKETEKLPPGRPEPVFEYVSRELGLNQQQREQYDALRKEHHRLQRLLQDSITTARNACFASMKSNTGVPDSTLRTLVAQTGYFQQQLELLNYNHFRQLRQLCNANQQAKLDRILETILKRFSRQGPPPPPHAGRPPHDGPPDGPEPGDR